MPTLRLQIADDHEIIRQGLRALLEAQPGWEVVAEASDGREAVQNAKQLKPDVSIVDIGMPGLNGIEATRQIIRDSPQAKVLVLTVHEADGLVRELLAVGARGYLLKTDAASDLIHAVSALQRDQTYFTPKVAEMLGGGYSHNAQHSEDRDRTVNRLTPRQKEIVQLLAEGKSTKEAAAILGVTVKTAETHRSNIMNRLNCHSMAELVRYAVRNRLVEP